MFVIVNVLLEGNFHKFEQFQYLIQDYSYPRNEHSGKYLLLDNENDYGCYIYNYNLLQFQFRLFIIKIENYLILYKNLIQNLS